MTNPDFGTTGNSIWNQPYIDHLTEHFFPSVDLGALPDRASEFLEVYPQWIASSQFNSFTGLDKFPHRWVSLGTTQTLDWFHYYCAANGLRIRMMRGEYPYNRDALLEGVWTHDRYIGDRPLIAGDAVIVSVPFSGTGRVPPRWNRLLEECNAKQIPVLVDCAWFGTCWDIDVDLSADCIKLVSFSTTKGLSCGNWRSGITFSRIAEGSLAVQTEWLHGIHLNTAIGLELMQNFSPDTLVKKYRDAHAQVCVHYGLDASNTIHIATSDDPAYDSYSRDGAHNRINIRTALKRYNKNGTFTQ